MTRAHAPASCQQQDFGVVQAFFQQILHDLLDDQRAHEGVATCTQRKQSEDGSGAWVRVCLRGGLLCSVLGVAPLHTSLEQYGTNLRTKHKATFVNCPWE